MVTDADYGFISLREEPKLILIQCHPEKDCLRLEAPGMEPLNLDIHIPLSNTVTCR